MKSKEFTQLPVTPIPGGNGSQYFAKAYDFINDDHSKWHSPEGSHPIDHVICYWHQPYFYYGRSRQRKNGSVPRSRKVQVFRAPCSIGVIDCGAFSWSPGYPPKISKVRSDNAKEV